MCCCCCPPAISALFCLWVKSGFSKASVAGALTFFPPEPALYRFLRIGTNGEVLEDDEESVIEDLADDESYDGEEYDAREDAVGGGADVDGGTEEAADDDDEQDVDDDIEQLNVVCESELENTNHKASGGGRREGNRQSLAYSGRKPDEDIVPTDDGIMKMMPKRESALAAGAAAGAEEEQVVAPLSKGKEAETQKTKKKKKKKKPTSAAAMLTERSNALHRRARRRNARDVVDAAAGVVYQFVPDPRLATPPSFPGTIEAVKIGPQKKTGAYIAALIYRVSRELSNDRTKTILYSHGNATDVGAMSYMQAVLAKCLDVNVVMYDYSGYGASGGVPLEANTYRDIKLVYDYTVQHVAAGGDESNVVLYGQSVGSGPSCYLCSKTEEIGGLILHSPFTSGMRVLTPSRALACLDIYPNIDRISKVKCPVMVIHGQLDAEVGVQHGVALHRAVPEEYRTEPWWVPDRGHNDITDGPGKMSEYIRRLRSYLDGLD